VRPGVRNSLRNCPTARWTGPAEGPDSFALEGIAEVKPSFHAWSRARRGVCAGGGDGFGDGQAQDAAIQGEIGVAIEGNVAVPGAPVIAAGGDAIAVGAVAGGVANQGAMQLAAGVQGQHAVVAHVLAGCALEGVGAQNGLGNAGPGGEALDMGAQGRIDFEGTHRLAVGEGQASSQVALAGAPLQQRGRVGRAMGRKGVDLLALAQGDLPVEMGPVGGRARTCRGASLHRASRCAATGSRGASQACNAAGSSPRRVRVSSSSRRAASASSGHARTSRGGGCRTAMGARVPGGRSGRPAVQGIVGAGSWPAAYQG
jgi:hypothetical protein